MDYIVLIVYGFVFGLFAAVPIGPVNLLCIRRTLELGSLYGFVAGLGATCGDTLFAIALGFGLTAVRQLIAGFSFPLQLIGGLLLVSIGVRTYFAQAGLQAWGQSSGKRERQTSSDACGFDGLDICPDNFQPGATDFFRRCVCLA